MLDKLKSLFRGRTVAQATGSGAYPIGYGNTITVDYHGDIIFATCVEILAKQLAQVKWGIYDKENAEASNLSRDRNFPINICPYPGITAYDFWNYMEKQRLGTGNAIAYILYDDIGRLQSLVPLDASKVRVYWDNADLFKGERKLVYEYIDQQSGVSFVMLPDEVLHVKAFSANGIIGRPAIQVLRDTLQSNAEVEGALRTAVSNGFHGTIVLQYTSDLSIQKQELLQAKVAKMLANNKRGNVLPLPVGITAMNIANDIKAYHDTLKTANAQAISSFFGVPLVMLNIGGGTGMATFSANQITQYYNLTVAPIIKAYANELSLKLLTRKQLNAGYYFDTSFDAFDFLDPQSKASVLVAYKASGIVSANEARASIKYEKSGAEGSDDLTAGGTPANVSAPGNGDRHDQQ